VSEPFKREDRFIVIKRKYLVGNDEERIADLLDTLGVITCECVVVESDWPEYETVWKMIEARCTRTPPTNTEAEGLAERLMREFYLSDSYDPNAARPADNVKAAIAFALSSPPEVEVERLRNLLCLADETLMNVIGSFPLDAGPVRDACLAIRRETGKDYQLRKLNARAAIASMKGAAS
jgi:hypothetical protein